MFLVGAIVLHGAHLNELLSNTRKSLQLMSKLINSKCKSTKTAKKLKQLMAIDH